MCLPHIGVAGYHNEIAGLETEIVINLRASKLRGFRDHSLSRLLKVCHNIATLGDQWVCKHMVEDKKTPPKWGSF